MARKNQYIEQVDKAIGNKIYTKRITKGLSRQELAQSINVTHQQLQKYEKGKNRISMGRLILIANALNQPLEEFYKDLDSITVPAPGEFNTSVVEEPEDNVASEDNPPIIRQRLILELVRNFGSLSNEHQEAVSKLVRSLVKESEYS